MSNMEEVEAAEARMNTAKDALMKYIEDGRVIDRQRHKILLARMKKTQVEFLKAVADIGK